MQDLWKEKLEWDTELATHKQIKWVEILET